MRQQRILFVDDDPLVLEALKRSFRDQAKAWDMTFLSSPEAALKSYKNSPFDVVITDLAMPRLNGIDMVMAMRKVNATSAFILLTGTADLPQAVKAINEAQVFRFYTKPCEAAALRLGIQQAILHIASPEEDDHNPGESGGITGKTGGLGLAALNRIAFGILVVDRTGRVLLSNRAGDHILHEADGLILAKDRQLRAATVPDTEHLKSTISQALDKNAAEDESIGFSIERTSEKRPLNILVCATTDTSNPTERDTAIIFIADPERTPLPSAEAIARIFGLSGSEARLVHALTGGLRLDEAAKACGLTVSTARTYLKQVFSKTGTGRQPELVKLILTTPLISD